MSGDHNHAAPESNSSERRLMLALGITLAVLVVELAGGIISNSLALLSDAGHVLTDGFALALSLIAARISRRPLTSSATYGYHRVGLLSALVNGLSLVGVSIYIFYESYVRLVRPPEIDLSVMLPVAAGGLVANIVMVVVLGHKHEDLNMRSAWLHVLGDTLSSVGVIVAGVVVLTTGWRYADPIAGFLIGLIIIFGGLRVLRDVLRILLDFVPGGMEVEEVARAVEGVEGVLDVHDIHLRALTHGRVMFSAHVYVEDMLLSRVEGIRAEVEHRLLHMGIEHVVLQFESSRCDRNGRLCEGCLIGPEDKHAHSHHGH